MVAVNKPPQPPRNWLWRVARVLLVSAIGAAVCLYAGALVIEWRNERTMAAKMKGFDERALGSRAPSPETFAPHRMLERQPVVSEYKIVDRSEAGEFLEPDEYVLGVEIDGQARAYPINVMNGPAREIFNDELGGAAIAATW